MIDWIKKHRALTIGGLAVILLIAFFGYRYTKAQSNAVRYVTAQAQTGTLVSSVTGSGNVIVGQSATIDPDITGTVQNLSVSLNDQVKKGQHLFDIQNDQLQITADKAYSAYLQAKQAVATAQNQVLTAQQAVDNNSQDSGQAKAKVSLDQANQALSTAQTQLFQDQTTLTNMQNDNANHAGTHSDSDIQTQNQKIANDQTAVNTNQDNVNAANIAYSQSVSGSSTTIASAKTQLSSAQLAVTAAQKNVDSANADYQNDLKIAAERTVTAPIDGTITTVNAENGIALGKTSSSAASTGSSSSSSSSSSSGSSQAALVIEDLNSLKASVDVSEVDIAKVKAGQKATLTFDAVSDLTLTGKVEKVDSVGTVSQGVVTYTATIDFDSLDPKVKPGMTVTAAITTDVKENVLTVPNSAVKTSGATSTVQTMVNGKPQTQTVEVGDSNDTDTEITSGLKAGDTVVTQTITAAQAAASSTTRSSTGLSGLGALGGGGFGGGFRSGTSTTTRSN